MREIKANTHITRLGKEVLTLGMWVAAPRTVKTSKLELIFSVKAKDLPIWWYFKGREAIRSAEIHANM